MNKLKQAVEEARKEAIEIEAKKKSDMSVLKKRKLAADLCSEMKLKKELELLECI